MKINTDILKNMLRAILNTREEEMACGECFEKLDQFIEMKLKGKSPEEAMPMVRAHLNKCKDCREEYEALLTALENVGAEA